MESLANQTAQAISDGLGEVAVKLLDSNQDELKEQGWSFLSKLSDALQDTKLSVDQSAVYKLVLGRLCTVSNPKELAFAFMECCEVFRNSSTFHITVPYLTQNLMKLSQNQRDLDTVGDTLYSHIRTSTFSTDTHPLEEDDNDPDKIVVREGSDHSDLREVICTIVSNFIQPLSEDKLTMSMTARNQLTECILRILGYPLVFVMYEDDNTSDDWCCVRLIKLLVDMNPTISKVLFNHSALLTQSLFTVEGISTEPVKSLRNHSDDQILSSLGHIAYMVLYHDLSRDSMPSVYAAPYKLTTLLPSLCALYKLSYHDVVAYKTIKLLSTLVSNIEVGSLDHEYLDLSPIRETVRFMFWCMQFNELLTIRQGAAKLLPIFISKLNDKAKFYLFNWITETEKSPEVLSYVYTLIKDFVHKCWANEQLDGQFKDYCLKLMAKIFRAPDEDNEGNLIADLNKVSSALNLARYLVSRDRRRVSVFTQQMRMYIEEYVSPIYHCLIKERDNLTNRLKMIESGEFQPPEASLQVGAEVLEADLSVEKEATLGVLNKINLVLYVHSCLTEALT